MADERILIRAAEESGLTQEYASDPRLLQFYMRKLLKRGWAGDRSPTEQKYCGLVHRAEGKYAGQIAALDKRRQEHHQNAEKVNPDASGSKCDSTDG